MRSHESDPTGNESLALERIAFFSDAVIAIALTLLAIDLRIPDVQGVDDAAFMRMLGDLGPHYFAFLISFGVVALYWRAHHRMFRYIERWDGGLLGVNMVFLFVVVQQPLLASMLGSYGNLSSATAIYALGLAALGFSSFGMWLYVLRRHLLTPGLPAPYVRYTSVRSGGVATAFLLSAGLALISPLAVQVSWILITLSSFLLRRKMLPD
ncbi:MAG TPA: TMEM175 family protein [Candidatus Limnocylindrales bacterium]